MGNKKLRSSTMHFFPPTWENYQIDLGLDHFQEANQPHIRQHEYAHYPNHSSG